jgi:hypothetical protein
MPVSLSSLSHGAAAAAERDRSAPEGLPMRTRKLLPFVGIVPVLAVIATPSAGYIHFPPLTMPKMCKESTNIRVLAVKKHDKEKRVIVYEVIKTLKGKNPKGMSFKHAIRKGADGAKPIFDWVGDGKRAVMFTIEGNEIACGYVFIDKFCYSVDYNRKGDFWLLVRVDPEMSACFHGSVEQLQKVTKDLLDGKHVKVPVDGSVKPLPLEERQKRAPALNEILKKNRGK